MSKLIWIGNGGRRPQYGNPETKPGWWPQHILPWGEMKKMGGRKSVELSHINYTEVLKQCLAAVSKLSTLPEGQITTGAQEMLMFVCSFVRSKFV